MTYYCRDENGKDYIVSYLPEKIDLNLLHKFNEEKKLYPEKIDEYENPYRIPEDTNDINRYEKYFNLKRRFTIEEVNNNINNILFPKKYIEPSGWGKEEFWIEQKKLLVNEDEIWEYSRKRRRQACFHACRMIMIINDNKIKWIKDILYESLCYARDFQEAEFIIEYLED